MSKELKPCPFCGGEAEFYRDTVLDNFRYCDVVFARCMECGARTKNVFYDALVHVDNGEYKDAAKAWNRREPMDKIVEQLEEYKNLECDDPNEDIDEEVEDAEELYDLGRSQGKLEAYLNAIEIVKGGAV